MFDHVLTAYGDNGETAYDSRPDFQRRRDVTVEHTGPLDINRIADDVITRIHTDAAFAAQMAAQLGATPMGEPASRHRRG